ncbi:LPS biosynthesis glycosyltransferase [Zobellella taiwanensis]|uniref:LPS biosynthesis glycosyltransferase n=1 Tax=Zobellella taiwanensis TaxID=347535 RepID=A0A2P7QXX0_9GAMM|nr:glycosyltransferase family 25 protein [Zobellella taiwanensis]PSJ42795.1 LPS biosynthesis glycosyltransferase [Zobellella taiwanensis]
MPNHNNLPHVYVISLPRHHERRSLISKQLNRLGFNFEFIEGIDGSKLDSETLDKVDLEFCKKKFGHSMNNSEIGCALSHIKVYEKIIEERLESAIVLEDDAFLLSVLPAVLKSALKKQPNFELLYLFHGKAKSWPIKNRLPDGYRLAKYRYPSNKSKRCIIGAVGYVLSQSGAKRLLELAHPVRMPADYLTGYLQWHRLNTYGIEPNCIDTGHLDTTIPGRDYGVHIENNK